MFEKKLKALLKSKNMSVSELAKATGIPKTNIQQWMTGSSPNIAQADKVAIFFNISIEELVFDRRPKSTIEDIFAEALIHTGHYKIQITKLSPKNGGEEG